jgi:hypothetical protein
MGTTVRPSLQTRTREALPAALLRDRDGAASARTRQSAERPASIKDAIIRWLNEEL